MKKEILSAIGIIAGILFGTTLSLSAQEKLSLKQCREMALKYNKEMAAADRQTEAARLMSLSYKANFFPNFTANGTGIYSTADGSLGIPGGNLPVFMPNPTTGELVSSGFAYFPGLNLDYKVGTVYSGGIQMEQPLYMGGKIRASYKMSLEKFVYVALGSFGNEFNKKTGALEHPLTKSIISAQHYCASMEAQNSTDLLTVSGISGAFADGYYSVELSNNEDKVIELDFATDQGTLK